MKKLIVLMSLGGGLVFSSGPRALGGAGLPADSLYQLTSEWSRQDDRRQRLGELEGRPVLITMAYTGCEYTCPLVVEKLKNIEADLRKKGGTEYRVVIASFDPDGDRPAKLTEFMKKRKITDAAWTMLVADNAASTRELAILLGINYKAEGGGHFSHSNVIALLDSRGRLTQKINGLNADHEALVATALKEAKPHGRVGEKK